MNSSDNTYYKYNWANNEKRKTLKGRICIVISRSRMNSCCVEFIDNRQREIVSRNSLRKTHLEKSLFD